MHNVGMGRVGRTAVAGLSLLLVVGLAGCRWRPPAASVDGEEITVDELKDDIDMLRDNPELAGLVFSVVPPEDAPVPADLTAQVLTMRIVEPMLADSYERSPNKLSAEDEAAQRQDLESQLLAALGGDQATLDRIPDAYVDRLVGRLVHSTALFSDVPAEERPAVAQALFGSYDIEVDPKYGSWDPLNYQVVTNPVPGAPTLDLSLLSPQQ
ncbi:MAG: hypothetical protein AB7W59_04880 [Acidimicrobiia bacterium]